jgi:hypothetical protein
MPTQGGFSGNVVVHLLIVVSTPIYEEPVFPMRYAEGKDTDKVPGTTIDPLGCEGFGYREAPILELTLPLARQPTISHSSKATEERPEEVS